MYYGILDTRRKEKLILQGHVFPDPRRQLKDHKQDEEGRKVTERKGKKTINTSPPPPLTSFSSSFIAFLSLPEAFSTFPEDDSGLFPLCQLFR